MEAKHVIVILAAILLAASPGDAVTFDLKDLGVNNGDITDALLKAWKLALNETTKAKILIGPGEWTLKQARLEGPNKAPIEIQVAGTVKAPEDPYQLPNKAGEWIMINYVNHFTMNGGGVFDGQGKVAWTKNDCNKNQKCMKLPYNLSFNFINNSLIHDITSKDSKSFHANCISSNNVTFERFKVVAPGDSPNTDGIHIARVKNVKFLDSTIETGDDCISFGDEIDDVLIKGVRCGPGHGISIGSLGRSIQEKDVTGITVDNCSFVGSTNGVRIKSWPSTPGTITVSDIVFTNLVMDNVSNPIIIDQQYCPWNMCNKQKASLVQIKKVRIENVVGTSFTQDVMTFSCSSSKPCQDVKIGNIDLKYVGNPALGGPTTVCENLKYTSIGKQNPPLCVPKPKPMPK